MKNFLSALSIFAVVTFAGIGVSAQETEERVVDEVVAQVNEGVITLSRIKREAKSIVDEQVKAGKTREEAQKMVDEKQGELIANLINEELIIQRAKELNLDSQIDATVNDRFVQIMKQYNMKSLEVLHDEMQKSGVDPTEVRELWRKQATRDLVLQREVQAKEYWRPSSKELREYYDKNKARFTKPETVSVSEVFIGFAGRDEQVVRDKAKQLVTQLRAGGDFDKAAKENDPPLLFEGTGKGVKVSVASLSDLVGKPLKGLKVGEITEPIQVEQVGLAILRVDGREQASSESFFDENAVRMAILSERAPAATKEFMSSLRRESYIKIGETYRPIVSPILFSDDRKEKAPGK
jgi:polyhydroxyalkanoate synthesis regulator phasin